MCEGLCCVVRVCITASTRKVYEKKLQQLLEQPPVETTISEAVTIIADGNQNGNTHSAEDQYSDKEEGRIALNKLFVFALITTTFSWKQVVPE